MSRGLIRLGVLVLAAFLLIGFSVGCQSETAKKIKRKTKKSANNALKAKPISEPEDWPKEIPTYPNSELLEVTATPENKTLVFKTDDTADKIFEWYYDKLEAAQWNMKGPTLDVSQNLAIIKSELGPLSFLLDARRRTNEKGETDGTTIKLTTPAPKLF